jgi:hypothetical protein
MKELNEEELDDFFQKALEGKPIPFNTKAWEKMEAKLDQHRRKRLWWKRFLLVGLFLFFSLTVSYYLKEQKSENIKEDKNNLPKIEKQSAIQDSQTINTEPNLLNNNQIQKNTDLPKEEKHNSQTKGIEQQDHHQSNQQGLNNTPVDKDNNKGVAVKPRVNPLRLNLSNQQNNQLFSTQKETLIKTQQLPDTFIENQRQELKLTVPVSWILIRDSLFVLSKLDSVSIEKIALSKVYASNDFQFKLAHFPRFSIGGVLAPDWSAVNFGSISQTGYKLGIELEYLFSKRLSVTSGIIFSRLRYSAKGDEYTTPKGFWTYQIRPEMVWATCDALEVPINLRYSLLTNEKSRIFVSSGISSYWMLSEDYRFQYKASTPPNIVKGWSGKNASKHYFSIINLSLGYAGRWNERVYWQVEPFVKLPLGGVGWGKVNLSSTGVFFTLKYVVIN